MFRRFALAFAVAVSFAACDYPRVIMSPEPQIHPATDPLAAVSSKVDQAIAETPALKTTPCETAYEWKGATQRYVAAALRKDGDAARRFASQLYRYMRCVSALDFVSLQRRFAEIGLSEDVSGDEQIRGAVDEIMAPLVFMIHDMGGRLADSRYREWLIARRGQLLRAASNKSSFLSTLGMFGAYGDFLREVSPREALGFVTELGAISGRCGYFEMAHLEADLTFCPRDCTLFTNIEVSEGLDSTNLGREIQELCGRYNELQSASSPELRGQLKSCIQTYGKTIERLDVAVCLDVASDNTRGSDGIYRTSFRRQVHVLDHCAVEGQTAPEAAKSAQEQEARKEVSHADEQLAELRRTHTELKGLYSRCVDFGHGERCAATLGHLVEVIDARVKAIEDKKHKQEAKLSSLKAAPHCQLDGTACSARCGVAGQLLQDHEACYGVVDEGHSQAPAAHSPLEIPHGKLNAKSPVAALSSCIRKAFASVAMEQPLCSKSILCGDGSAPRVDGNACVCVPSARAKLTRETCETVIDCPDPKRVCSCDGVELPGVYGRASSAQPATLLMTLSP